MANASAAPFHPLLSSIISTSTSSRSHSLLSAPPEYVPIASNPSKLSVTTTTADSSSSRKSPLVRRRDLVAGISLTAALTKEPLSVAAREVEVGSYLPPAPTDPAFVVFKATSKDTPALRAGNFFSAFLFFRCNAYYNLKELHLAGNVQPYEFILPPTWKQTRVANILSGNYCQPKCAEPWVEVKFEDEKQGKVQVVASPLVRLTNKPNATIEDIGSPEKVIASLGPFVTGNTFDSDELLEASIEKSGDLTVNFLTSNLLT
ncbi:hypothetical protein B296_00002767 [Ensete ventricosum]|uniref:PsbP C-terminal domain-containing protein n=1 Tax=Ensete ventricosum TaxID=4639 RepID=A0A427B7N5_ENSVE|nr:hypothetical protein B296_00002767 [Ensete ventricosum]